MESARAIIENARMRIGMLMAAGAIALGASGCSAPDEEVTPTPSASAEAAAPTFTAPEGADKLPLVTSLDPTVASIASVSGDSVNTTALNVAVEHEPRKYDWMETYTMLSNNAPKGAPEGDMPPSGESAKVLDFMVNSQGKLVYEDFTPNNQIDTEEAKIIQAMAEEAPLLEPAMRAGDVGKVHVRVGEPDSQATDEYTTDEEAQFLPVDYNDGGKPSIYVNMKGVDYMDIATLKLETNHELSHAQLRQIGKEDYSPQDVEVLNRACETLRTSALSDIQEHSYEIVDYLEFARQNMQKQYRPAMSKVIKAIETNKYANLPLQSGDPEAKTIPNCFVQTPWSSYLGVARSMHLKDKHGKPAGIGDPAKTSEYEAKDFNDSMQAAMEAWDEVAKTATVYEALNEATYLDGGDADNKKWGHSYENVNELTASILNALEKQPLEFGKLVAKMEPAEKQAIVDVAERGVQRVLLLHQNEPAYQKLVGDQHAVFLAAAGEI